LTQVIVSKLREDIFEGIYRPGARLSITDLARQFNASAVPVREALRNLQTEGLVEFQLNKGVSVKQLSREEVRELFLIRTPLESIAAAEAADLWTSESQLDSLAHILDLMDQASANQDGSWHKLHDTFHTELSALCKLPRITALISLYRGQMRPYSKICFNDADYIANAQAEHRELLACLRSRDREKIKEILHQHLARPARKVLDMLGDEQAPDRNLFRQTNRIA
jgi:DNA-binding GntR family transcriptional regulator